MTEGSKPKSAKVIGIDLGTTNSAFAIYDSLTETPKIYANLVTGKNTTPSVIALKKVKGSEHKEWIIGDGAKNAAATNPKNTFYGIKRIIGTKYSDERVAKMQQLASYEIVKGTNGDAWVMVDGVPTAPEAISAKVLGEIKKQAEQHLNNAEEIVDAVITVPAYFDDAQRQATKDAATMAGLNVVRMINEPTAAALAYGVGQEKDETVAVFDLGGGTFDVSIVNIMQVDDQQLMEVVSGSGDTFLGGEGFDEAVTARLLQVLQEENPGFEIDAGNRQKLRLAAERLKIELSGQTIATVTEAFLGLDSTGNPVSLDYTMPRKELEDILRPQVIKTLDSCKKALADAGMSPSDLDKVILVGGQTRMPLVIDTVRDFFGMEPSREVNPDEIVALGASVQGAIVRGGVDNVVLRDVTPMGIGVKLSDGTMMQLVPRGTPIPFTNKEDPNVPLFSNARDNQPNFNIEILQGERPRAEDNRLLGDFVMNGLPPLPKGTVQLKIVMSIDENSLLTVTAMDVTNPNKPREMTCAMKTNGGLSEADIQRMIEDAEKHKAADDAFKLAREERFTAQNDLTNAANDEQQEYFTSATEEQQQAFKEAFEELTTVVKTDDGNAIKESREKLSKIRQDMAKAFYGTDTDNSAADNSGPSANPPAGPEGPAV